MERLQQITSHLLTQNETGPKVYTEQRSSNKLDWFKDNGWGYKDTEFIVDTDGQIKLTGSRYLFSGQKLPKFRAWAEEKLGIDLNITTPAQPEMKVDPPKVNEEFMNEIKDKVNEITLDNKQRIHHSHGHTLQELYAIRHEKLPKVVDAVVFVDSHAQSENLVKLAVKHNVVLIPYGGGTNVTQALMVRSEEQRMIVSVDMTRMNHVLWVDRENMTACIEAGILGKDLERELARYGVILGHEPDSVEFSTLGGWISTRASGMKKNIYGNIEDIVLNVKIVTPIGTFTKASDYPRISSGPDLNEFILGSEGTFGIITEAVVKIKNTPKVRQYGSIVFPNFEVGTQFMYDVAKSKIWPASIRLVDNTQFVFGMSLKPDVHDKKAEFMEKIKKYYLFEYKKLDINQIAVVTLLFEGNEQEVAHQEKSIYSIAKKHHGIKAGAENGLRGYFLTFVIAYLRDYGFNYSFIAESFETSCPWKNVGKLCKAVGDRIVEECAKRGVQKKPFVSMRVTQVYDTGAAVYVYFGFNFAGVSDPVRVYSEVEDAAREEIMKQGGSISHHHGVGKLRKKFLVNSVGETGVNMLKGIKNVVDPTNIFANGNLI